MFIYSSAVEGAWSVAVGAVVIAAAPRDASELLDGVVAGRSAAVLLDGVLRSGISSAPSFVLLERVAAGTVRVFLRGDAVAALAREGGELSLSGQGVSSWTEQLVDGVSGVRVDVPGGSFRVPLSAGGGRTTAAVPASGAVPASASLPASTPVPASASAPSDPGQTITSLDFIDAAAEPEPSESGYDHLFGETMFRDVAVAAVREEPADEEPEVAGSTGSPEDDGDHDGETVFTSELPARAPRAARSAAAAESPAGRRYAVDLPGGIRETLDRSLVLGRSPSASRVPATDVPRLVTIGGEDNDISRSHVRIAVEGDTVVVTDLHSRNGTLLQLPGKPSQRLRPGEPATVLPGATLDLGGGVVLSVVEI